MSESMKKCKHCQSEIDKKANICPNCRKKQGGKLKFIVIGIVVVIIIYAIANPSDDKVKEAGNEVTKSPVSENTSNDSDENVEETQSDTDNTLM